MAVFKGNLPFSPDFCLFLSMMRTEFTLMNGEIGLTKGGNRFHVKLTMALMTGFPGFSQAGNCFATSLKSTRCVMKSRGSIFFPGYRK
jgi:hypothetical protein